LADAECAGDVGVRGQHRASVYGTDYGLDVELTKRNERMDALKIKQLIKGLEELQSHLTSSQGMDLKSLLDSSKAPKVELGEELPDELGKPKGVSISKVSVLEKPKQGFDDKVNEAIASQDGDEKPSMLPDEDEMTDEELEELLGKVLKK
jgi:hypothetical protein